MSTEEHLMGPRMPLPTLPVLVSSQPDISRLTMQAIDYIALNFVYFRGNVHVMICLLLSSRYGLSQGAEELGEVMWPSPPHFFASLLSSVDCLTLLALFLLSVPLFF